MRVNEPGFKYTLDTNPETRGGETIRDQTALDPLRVPNMCRFQSFLPDLASWRWV